MKKIILNEFIIQYQFIEHLDRVSYTTSIYAIIHENKVLLIDTGYEKYARLVLDDLEKNSLDVQSIIITHFHSDHAGGLILFDDCDLYASNQYHKCFNKLDNKSGQYPIPNKLVEGQLDFSFYNYSITLLSTPGHTPCSITVIIDDTYLFPGDLILEDLNGKVIIPYIDVESDPKMHLQSLRKILMHLPKHIFLSHGPVIWNVDLPSILSDRLYYLETFIRYDYDIDIEMCLINDIDEYAMTAIHKLNKRNGKRLIKK